MAHKINAHHHEGYGNKKRVFERKEDKHYTNFFVLQKEKLQ